MLTPPSRVRAYLERRRRADPARPSIERDRVEGALAEHLGRLGLPAGFPIRWQRDGVAGLISAAKAAYHPAWVEAWRLAERAWARMLPASIELREVAEGPSGEATALTAVIRRAWRSIHGVSWGFVGSASLAAAWGLALGEDSPWGPLTEAVECGLWLHWATPVEALAVPRPALFVRDARLHREDGPAVAWAGGGARLLFWEGVEVTQRVIEDYLTAEEILAERNVAVRRAMIARHRYPRFLRDLGAKVVDEDSFGRLYVAANPTGGEPLVVVRVVTRTAEPNGTHRHYFLRVPPAIQKAKDAVAWTFDIDPESYAPWTES